MIAAFFLKLALLELCQSSQSLTKINTKKITLIPYEHSLCGIGPQEKLLQHFRQQHPESVFMLEWPYSKEHSCDATLDDRLIRLYLQVRQAVFLHFTVDQEEIKNIRKEILSKLQSGEIDKSEINGRMIPTDLISLFEMAMTNFFYEDRNKFQGFFEKIDCIETAKEFLYRELSTEVVFWDLWDFFQDNEKVLTQAFFKLLCDPMFDDPRLSFSKKDREFDMYLHDIMTSLFEEKNPLVIKLLQEIGNPTLHPEFNLCTTRDHLFAEKIISQFNASNAVIAAFGKGHGAGVVSILKERQYTQHCIILEVQISSRGYALIPTSSIDLK